MASRAGLTQLAPLPMVVQVQPMVQPRQPAARRQATPAFSAIVPSRAGPSAALQAARRRCSVAVTAAAGGDVLVLGTTGQQAARVALQLLKSGAKVTAAVDDAEEAAEVRSAVAAACGPVLAMLQAIPGGALCCYDQGCCAYLCSTWCF